MSQIQWRFLRAIFGKNYLGIIFQKFSCKPSLSATNTCEILPYFLQYLFCIRILLKKFKWVLSYVVCTQVRRNDSKRITKRKNREEKAGRAVFGKPVLFTLGLGLTASYSLGVLFEIFTRRSSLCLLTFGWDLSPRFVQQDWQ